MNQRPCRMSLALACLPLGLAAQSPDPWTTIGVGRAFAPGTGPWTELVDGRVSLLFPVAPVEVAARQLGIAPPHPAAGPDGRKTGFIAQDPHGTYVLAVNGTAGAAVDPEDPAARRAYYEKACRHVAQREGGAVLARSFFSTPAGEGTEVKYAGHRAGTDRLVVKYSRQVLVGPVEYFLSFLPADRTDSTGQAGHAQRRRFFDSLAVTPVSDK